MGQYSQSALGRRCDFGGKLEAFRLLTIQQDFQALVPEKGVCLARCTGELHPSPSGWIYLNSEVLELLVFWRAEQRLPNALWRPIWEFFLRSLSFTLWK